MKRGLSHSNRPIASGDVSLLFLLDVMAEKLRAPRLRWHISVVKGCQALKLDIAP